MVEEFEVTSHAPKAPGWLWFERMLREESDARRAAAPLADAFGPGSDVNLFYTDLVTGPDDNYPDPMRTPPPDRLERDVADST
jgi:hypothetical protein